MTPSTLTDTQARAELARLMGVGLVPQDGCYITPRSLGDATVQVEYEREGDDIAILNVLINGRMCDAEDVIQPTTLERWREELREEAAEHDGPDPDDSYDAWKDAA